MEFIEDDQADAGQFGIILQQTLQHPFGDHFDARGGADPRFQSNAIADPLTHRLTQHVGQTLGYGASSQAPRFKQQNALSAKPVTVQQRQRHQSRLAGAGGRLKNCHLPLPQRIIQFAENRADG